MYNVSSRFLQQVTQSHTITTDCVVSKGATTKTLSINAGWVRVDASAEIRRSANVTLTDPDGTLVPATAADLLTPLGTELRLSRGVQYPDGTTELVPLGVFVLVDVDMYDSGDGLQIELNCMDRSIRISDARLTQEYNIALGTNYATAIQTLLQSRASGLSFDFMSTTATTPNITLPSAADPWTEARKMAESFGAELFFDVNGVCCLKPIPNPLTAAVVAFAEGTSSVVAYLNKRYDREETYNGYIATGENTDNTVPVRGEAWDDDPASPTYRYGPFGMKPAFFSSPFITTNTQAQEAAQGLLRRKLGLAEGVYFSCVPNTAIDVNDVISVKRGASKLDATFVIERLSIPMTQDALMHVTCRKRRVQ